MKERIEKLKLFIAFLKRAKAQWYKELAAKHMDEWYGEAKADPKSHYEFRIKHLPVEGLFCPQVIISQEKASTKWIDNRRKEWGTCIEKYSNIVDIHLTEKDGMLSVSSRNGSKEKICRTREEALFAIQLYKETNLDIGVSRETIETITQ